MHLISVSVAVSLKY